jgi:hypothetical protein
LEALERESTTKKTRRKKKYKEEDERDKERTGTEILQNVFTGKVLFGIIE